MRGFARDNLELTVEEVTMIAGFRFLSLKPILILLNVGEEQVTSEPDATLKTLIKSKGLSLVAIATKPLASAQSATAS